MMKALKIIGLIAIGALLAGAALYIAFAVMMSKTLAH
jgi:hypothetical protein